VSKNQESVLGEFIVTHDTIDDYMTTALCTHVFKQTIDLLHTTFLPALWILTKHSVMWIIGCCFVSCLIMLPQLRDAWQRDCSRTGILTSTCMCDGNMQRPSNSVFKMVFGKAVFSQLFYLDSTLCGFRGLE